jgi:hypothetical protein
MPCTGKVSVRAGDRGAEAGAETVGIVAVVIAGTWRPESTLQHTRRPRAAQASLRRNFRPAAVLFWCTMFRPAIPAFIIGCCCTEAKA